MIAQFADKLRARRNGAQLGGGSVPEVVVPERGPESQWFWQHYDEAASQILEAFQSEGLSLNGKVVADVGCGDGFMDLGVLHKARPRRLVGFDVNLTNREHLQRRAREEGVDAADLGGLDFEQSTTTRIPVEDGAFDFAFSWSAFEHISRPIEVLTEIKRILSPAGAFFLQLWPFYHSSKGSHLWEWFPEDYHHLQRAECDIVQELEVSDVKPADWTSMMSREFQHLNRITVDELQRSMLAAGFVVRRVELLTGATRLTPELGRYSWLDLGIGGIKLIATPG
ncbi:MAG TPA: class I SAM-dependent methyltransferase [Solirubrobacteraceae bacterium]|jgi:ubiquinone/menaquinone biosynthesis C-methylase UbiE|nr:class I SAM-dependent methyltransferase [Solirubrobacteraceae bacterium]